MSESKQIESLEQLEKFLVARAVAAKQFREGTTSSFMVKLQYRTDQYLLEQTVSWSSRPRVLYLPQDIGSTLYAAWPKRVKRYESTPSPARKQSAVAVLKLLGLTKKEIEARIEALEKVERFQKEQQAKASVHRFFTSTAFQSEAIPTMSKRLKQVVELFPNTKAASLATTALTSIELLVEELTKEEA